MKRRAFLYGLISAALATMREIEAQPAGKVYRVGILVPGGVPDPSVAASVNLVPVALRELGYAEGRNLVRDLNFA